MTQYVHYSGPSTYELTLTASGSTHTKGTYVELTPATSFDSSRCRFYISSHFTAPRLNLTDLSVGANGVEVVVLANILSQTGTDLSGFCNDCIVYIDIPSGTRLTARTQSATGSAQCVVRIHLEDRPLGALDDTVTYGAVTGTTRGKSVDPGGSVDTKGVYTEITPATSMAHHALLIVTGMQGNAAIAFNHWNVDISTGANGVEVVIIPDLVYHTADLGEAIFPSVRTLAAEIPSGTRLTARAAASTTDATDRLFDIQLVGMDDVGGGKARILDNNTIAEGMVVH